MKDVCELGYWEYRGDGTVPGKALTHGKSKMDVVDYYDREGWPVVIHYREAARKEQQKGENHGTYWYVDKDGCDSRTYDGGRWRHVQPIYELTEDSLIVTIETHLMHKQRAADRFSFAFSRVFWYSCKSICRRLRVYFPTSPERLSILARKKS